MIVEHFNESWIGVYECSVKNRSGVRVKSAIYVESKSGEHIRTDDRKFLIFHELFIKTPQLHLDSEKFNVIAVIVITVKTMAFASIRKN